jgi:chromosome segregation ATPase
MVDEPQDTTEETTQDTEAPEEPKPEARFTQADLDKVVADRLERERKKQERDREAAERAAREKALADQEDWKKLAAERTDIITERDQRIAELEPVSEERDQLKARMEALEKRLAGLIKPRLEAVPELFRPFVLEKSVEEQAEWLEKNADKLNGKPAGSPATGRPAATNNTEKDKEARERQRQARVSTI